MTSVKRGNGSEQGEDDAKTRRTSGPQVAGPSLAPAVVAPRSLPSVRIPTTAAGPLAPGLGSLRPPLYTLPAPVGMLLVPPAPTFSEPATQLVPYSTVCQSCSHGPGILRSAGQGRASRGLVSAEALDLASRAEPSVSQVHDLRRVTAPLGASASPSAKRD